MITMYRLLTFFIILVSLSACRGLASEPVIISTIQPRPTIDISIPENLGIAVFDARCSSCHGELGQGDGAVALDAGLDVPDFTLAATSAEQSLTQWTNTIRFGRLENMMPPWENSLSEEEINAVAEYTFTLWQDFPQTVAENSEATEEPLAPIVEEAIGTITGDVIQGTANASIPDVISVALHVIDTEGNEANFDMQVLQQGTTYSFEDILIRHDYTYFLTAIHNEVVFYSDVVFGTPQSPMMNLPITIYEVTHDEAVIEIDLFLIRLIPSDGELVIQQLINFTNTSDYVYRGDNQIDGFTYDSIRIPIPNDAQLLNSVELIPRFLLLEGETQQTILDTQPVMPNTEHLVELVYSLPTSDSERRLSVEFPVSYDVVQPVEIMVQPGHYSVEGDNFASSGAQHFSVGVYESYLSSELSANDFIQFAVFPSIGEASEEQTISQRRNLVSILALAGIALMSISIIVLFLGKDSETMPSE